LLSHDYNLQALVCPVSQDIHAITKVATQTIQLPDNRRLDLASEDIAL